ncbi:MAG: alpha/beta fold hydrolase [Planctomycetes bacterium]|nr:alpha/beta fold hydrolase [Planctomycetota bacterium]
MCRSTTSDEPPADTQPGQRLKHFIIITPAFAVAAYFAAAWFTPVISERAYYAWPPTALVGWLTYRTRRRLSLRQLATFAGIGLLAGAVITVDFVAGLRVFQTGEATRIAYCGLGFLLAMETLRRVAGALLSRFVRVPARTRIRLRLPLTIAWVLCYAALAYPFLMSYMQVHPPKRRDHADPGTALRIGFQDVSWQSRDGTTLRGWFVPADASERTAIVCHGVMDSKSGMMPFIRALHEGGYNVLAFDSRGHGESEGWTVTYGRRESEDIIAAVDYLESHHPLAVRHAVGVGWSMGAASLILAAADDPRIEVLHVDAPYASTADMARHIGSSMPAMLAWWSYYAGLAIGSCETGSNLFALDTTAAAARIAPRPIMIVHGTADLIVPFEQGQKVYAAAGEPKSFKAVPGAGHCQTIAYEGRRYTDRMIEFLDDALSTSAMDEPRAGTK